MIMLQDRNFFARECLQRHALDVLLVTSLPNIRYLAGFSGSDGVLLVTPRGGWFLTDSRYTTQAQSEVKGYDVVEYRNKLDCIADLVSAAGCRTVGFESTHVSVALRDELAGKMPGLELLPLKDDVDNFRTIKDAAEIALLDTCAGIASQALCDVLELVRPGAMERDLSLELEIAMKRRGADDKAFDFIVASGERGALPHGRASDRVIQAGELVTFDFGARLNGYHSDETVTVAVGEPDPRMRTIYGVVKEAQDRAIAAVKPGVALKELDTIARSFIDEQGYGSYFGHGLGHGVGLEVHEKPVVSFRSDAVAEEGMVFTIEPGIYIPGLGGVRLEDTVVVESSGCRLLTKVSKELRVL